MPSAFDPAVVSELERRIARLTPTTPRQWGKMSVDQMLAHCNVAYDMTYTDIHPKPGAIRRLLLSTFVKQIVVGPKPYKHNSPTAPQFRMVGPKDFARERDKLVAYVRRVQQDGASHFEGRESPSFGPLTSAEWSVLFYKHLDHHLAQFGV
jgi:Protein of unknown function (DUF1569)